MNHSSSVSYSIRFIAIFLAASVLITIPGLDFYQALAEIIEVQSSKSKVQSQGEENPQVQGPGSNVQGREEEDPQQQKTKLQERMESGEEVPSSDFPVPSPGRRNNSGSEPATRNPQPATSPSPARWRPQERPGVDAPEEIFPEPAAAPGSLKLAVCMGIAKAPGMPAFVGQGAGACQTQESYAVFSKELIATINRAQRILGKLASAYPLETDVASIVQPLLLSLSSILAREDSPSRDKALQSWLAQAHGYLEKSSLGFLAPANEIYGGFIKRGQAMEALLQAPAIQEFFSKNSDFPEIVRAYLDERETLSKENLALIESWARSEDPSLRQAWNNIQAADRQVKTLMARRQGSPMAPEINETIDYYNSVASYIETQGRFLDEARASQGQGAPQGAEMVSLDGRRAVSTTKYDSAGMLTSNPEGSWEFVAYDNRVVAVHNKTQSGEWATQVERYDASGKLAAREFPEEGITIAGTWDDQGKLIEGVQTNDADGSKIKIGPRGTIQTQVTTDEQGQKRNQIATFNAEGRLIKVEEPASGSVITGTWDEKNNPIDVIEKRTDGTTMHTTLRGVTVTTYRKDEKGSYAVIQTFDQDHRLISVSAPSRGMKQTGYWDDRGNPVNVTETKADGAKSYSWREGGAIITEEYNAQGALVLRQKHDLASGVATQTSYRPKEGIEKAVVEFKVKNKEVLDSYEIHPNGQVAEFFKAGPSQGTKMYKTVSDFENKNKAGVIQYSLDLKPLIQSDKLDSWVASYETAKALVEERGWSQDNESALAGWLNDAARTSPQSMSLFIDVINARPGSNDGAMQILIKPASGARYIEQARFEPGVPFPDTRVGHEGQEISPGRVLAVSVPVIVNKSLQILPPDNQKLGAGQWRAREYLRTDRRREWEFSSARSMTIIERKRLPDGLWSEPVKMVISETIQQEFFLHTMLKIAGEYAGAMPVVKEAGHAAAAIGLSGYHSLVGMGQHGLATGLNLVGADRLADENAFAALSSDYRNPAVRATQDDSYFIRQLYSNPEWLESIDRQVKDNRRQALHDKGMTQENMGSANYEALIKTEVTGKPITDQERLAALGNAYSSSQAISIGVHDGNWMLAGLGALNMAGQSSAEMLPLIGGLSLLGRGAQLTQGLARAEQAALKTSEGLTATQRVASYGRFFGYQSAATTAHITGKVFHYTLQTGFALGIGEHALGFSEALATGDAEAAIKAGTSGLMDAIFLRGGMKSAAGNGQWTAKEFFLGVRPEARGESKVEDDSGQYPGSNAPHPLLERLPASSLPEAVGRLQEAGILESMRPGQAEAAQAIIRGESPELGVGGGKTLSGDLATAVVLARSPKGSIAEYIAPDRDLAAQVVEQGGIGRFSSQEVAQTLGFTKVLGDKLYESYKQGDTRPLLDAYSGRMGPVQIVWSKEALGHFTRDVLEPAHSRNPSLGQANAQLRSLIRSNVKLLLFDEVHGIVTSRSNFIAGENPVALKVSDPLFSGTERLYNELSKVQEISFHEYESALKANPQLEVIAIDPLHQTIIKSPALETRLAKDGFAPGVVDSVLRAQRGRRDWAVDPNEGRVYPRGESGIMKESIFSDKSFEIAAYLREGLNPKGKVQANNTTASAILMEALTLRASAVKAGMSGSLAPLAEMVEAGIGSKVIRLESKAAGERMMEYQSLEAMSPSERVNFLVERIIESRSQGRGVLIHEPEFSAPIKAELIERGLGGNIRDINDLTTDKELMGEAKTATPGLKDIAAQDGLIIFSNGRGTVGVDYKGDIDIYGNAAHADLIQLPGRGARTTGTKSRVLIYRTESLAQNLSNVVRIEPVRQMLTQRWRAQGKSALADSLEDFLRTTGDPSHKSLTERDLISLSFETRLALEKSRAVASQIPEILRSRKLLEPLKELALLANTKSAQDIIAGMKSKVLNGETKSGAKAKESLDYSDPQAVIKESNISTTQEALAVLESLRAGLSRNPFTRRSNKDAIDYIDAKLNEIREIDFDKIENSKISNFAEARTLSDTLSVAKRLAEDVMLPQVKQETRQAVVASNKIMDTAKTAIEPFKRTFAAAKNRVTSLFLRPPIPSAEPSTPVSTIESPIPHP
ncbi:MAG: hypothetical protein HY547_04630, partial [Elusimicrobia bacterium]|nr:hypothetical protein [Elusimicrobiota bacterium]